MPDMNVSPAPMVLLIVKVVTFNSNEFQERTQRLEISRPCKQDCACTQNYVFPELMHLRGPRYSITAN